MSNRVEPQRPRTGALFDTVLIANRGEIALRVARTCRELGIRTVAVYSTADRDSAVVRFADEAVLIGPPAPKRSYLNPAALIEAARLAGADAIHPGYGFLSEDPYFPEICAANGITWIGPPPDVMVELADKAKVRALMEKAGLPVLPGCAEVSSGTAAQEAGDEIGYPLIIKAAAGGGGRGLTVVRNRREIRRAYEETRAAGQALFGDGRVYLEQFAADVRHVEVQVLCDGDGNVVHLGERDCSIQRRHQKLVEESPAPRLPEEVRAGMYDAALRAAQFAGLVGVGTIEFLIDEGAHFSFIEINGRIQVEHPVTEMVSGVDIVREQILVAAGHPLSSYQEQIAPRGVAIECRVNAENPDRAFAPTPGVVETVNLPGGPFTRVDTHAFPGWEIGPDYDSLLGKVIVWAPDRDQAIARMDRALTEFQIDGPGIHTTNNFLREVLSHPLFRDAKHTTSLVEQMSS